MWPQGVLSPWDVGPPDSVYFSLPKQAVTLSEPNFWIRSPQIHCNGLSSKTVTLQLAPFVGKLFVRRWVRELAKVGPNSLGETMMANMLGHKGRIARRFPAQQASGTICAALVPNRGQMTREPCGRPPLGPDGGRQRPHETLSRGSVVGLVLEDWYWCLLTHWSSWMGL